MDTVEEAMDIIDEVSTKRFYILQKITLTDRYIEESIDEIKALDRSYILRNINHEILRNSINTMRSKQNDIDRNVANVISLIEENLIESMHIIKYIRQKQI